REALANIGHVRVLPRPPSPSLAHASLARGGRLRNLRAITETCSRGRGAQGLAERPEAVKVRPGARARAGTDGERSVTSEDASGTRSTYWRAYALIGAAIVTL